MCLRLLATIVVELQSPVEGVVACSVFRLTTNVFLYEPSAAAA